MKTKTTATIKFLALSIFIVSLTGVKLNAQIKFETGKWADIKAKAKKENKLIFIDAYTSWCGPCKWLAKNVFTNDTVSEFYNATFINASFDMEKGEGIELAKKYDIRVYPSLLFVNANGEIIHRGVGGMKVAKFVELGKNALIPEKQFATLEKKYKSGQRDATFMNTYLFALASAYLDTKAPLQAYFGIQKEADLSNQQNWNIINNYVEDYHSKAFAYLLRNTDVFAKKYTTDSVNSKIFDVYENSLKTILYAKKFDSTAYTTLRTEIKNSGFSRSEEVLLNTDMNYFSKKGDYANYAKTAAAYLDKYNKKNPYELNEIAYPFYTNVKDKALLVKAEGWAKQMCEIAPNDPAYMDTYACLLFVNDKKQEAIKLEKQAIEIAKANNENNAQLIQDLEKNVTDWSK